MADPSTVSVVIPAFEEAAAVGVVVQSSARGGDLARGARHRRRVGRSRRRTVAATAGARVIRHPYNKGNGACCQDRHPARVRRVRAHHRWRWPAHRHRCVATGRLSRRVRSRRRRQGGIGSAGVGRAPRRQQRAELGGQLSHRPRHSRSHVGLARGADERPPRVSSSAAERILDADHDDAVVREGRLQRAVRADYGRAHGSASRKSSSSPTARDF